jgi:TatD DNase family protein
LTFFSPTVKITTNSQPNQNRFKQNQTFKKPTHNPKTTCHTQPKSSCHSGSRSNCVAVGECGLDYDRDFSPRDQQRAAFKAQLLLAMELALPVFLHERDAHADFVETWESAMREGAARGLKPVAGVVHCFTGPREQLQRYVDMGFFIGITGFVCNPSRAEATRECLGIVPAARLMIETDGPFMRPRNAPRAQSRDNEPALLPYVLDEVARLVGRSVAQVARETARATHEFFGFPIPDQ